MLRSQINQFFFEESIEDSYSDNVQSCRPEEFTITFINYDTNMTFFPKIDPIESLQVNIRVDSTSCLFSFVADLKTYDEHGEEWEYLLIAIGVLLFLWGLKASLLTRTDQASHSLDRLKGWQYVILNFALSYWGNLLAEQYFPDLILGEILNLGLMVIGGFIYWNVVLNIALRHFSVFASIILIEVIEYFTEDYPILAEISHPFALMALIIVPVLDIRRTFKSKMAPEYNRVLYFGYFLLLLTIIILSTLESNLYLAFQGLQYKLFVPEFAVHQITVLISLFLAFVVLPVQLKIFPKWYISIKDIDPEEECCICLGSLTEKTEDVGGSSSTQPKVPKLDCKHLYHEECLRGWLRLRPECPTCRTRLKFD